MQAAGRLQERLLAASLSSLLALPLLSVEIFAYCAHFFPKMSYGLVAPRALRTSTTMCSTLHEAFCGPSLTRCEPLLVALLQLQDLATVSPVVAGDRGLDCQIPRDLSNTVYSWRSDSGSSTNGIVSPSARVVTAAQFAWITVRLEHPSSWDAPYAPCLPMPPWLH